MSAPVPPRVYADWLPLLDRFRDGDDEALDLMQNGTIEWTNVVAERWTRRVDDAIAARLQAIDRQLQLGFDRSGGESFAISRAMLGARRALAPLVRFASMPGIPPQVATHLNAVLAQYAKSKQEGLERQAANLRHDNGRTLKAIRDNALTLSPVPAGREPATDASSHAAAPGPRRRIIL